MNTKKIAVDLVDVGERLRTLDPVYVAEIAASFEEKGGEAGGQISPIEVREADEKGRYRLIAGEHRVAAARVLGWKTIAASIVRCTNDEARMREIDENLVRRDLTILDRATFVAYRDTLWKQMHPESVRGRAGAAARWHASAVSAYASKPAKSLGVSEREVRYWLAIARGTVSLSGPLRERVAASDLANNRGELLALAALADDARREAVVELILSGAKDAPRRVADAVAFLDEVPAEHVTKAQADYDAFVARWAKYGADTRPKIAEFVARETKPRRQAPKN